jgi:hypothetical protein
MHFFSRRNTMSYSKKCLFFIVLTVVTYLLCLPLYAATRHGHTDASAESGHEKNPVYSPIPGPGKKVMIGNDYYFVYGFDKKPQMGRLIIKVDVYKMDGEKDTSMEIKGDAGMPSMRGAHDMGERPFKLSKNGDYLLPITIVMPGDWEIRLTFTKNGQVIFRGSYQFDV